MSKRKEELIVEAKAKGLLVKGSVFISVEGIPFSGARDTPDNYIKYDDAEDRLFIHTKSDDYTIYKKGTWCKIVTLEEAMKIGKKYYGDKHKGSPLGDILKKLDTVMGGRKETVITITKTSMGINVKMGGARVNLAEYAGMLELAKHSVITDNGVTEKELTQK